MNKFNKINSKYRNLLEETLFPQEISKFLNKKNLI